MSLENWVSKQENNSELLVINLDGSVYLRNTTSGEMYCVVLNKVDKKQALKELFE